MDSGSLAVLSLLDPLAAFDMVDHATIIQHHSTSYGLGGTTLSWFTFGWLDPIPALLMF